jgi:hypothetical protein
LSVCAIVQAADAVRIGDRMSTRSASVRRFLKGWNTPIVLLGGIISGLIAFYHWELNRWDEFAKAAHADRTLQQTRADAENTSALTRKLEAQRPFLQKQLDIYLETVQVAGRLTSPQSTPNTPVWEENARRFWQLRWSELEMVGDAGIRQAARRVGEQLIETEFNPIRDRHDLRWMVECLSDEVRLALEHSWGYKRDLTRETATGESSLKVPNGCSQDRAKPQLLTGMIPLVAPGNQ